MVNYRDAYDLFACNGILFNHESPLRPERFVTQKIIHSAIRIANGEQDELELGNIDIERDWGWAPEYVEAMWLMLQHEHAGGYVVATGRSHSLKTFIKTAFETVNLDWKQYVKINPTFIRPSELLISKGNPNKAKQLLGWQAKYQLVDIVREMMLAAKRKHEA